MLYNELLQRMELKVPVKFNHKNNDSNGFN